MHFFLFFRSTTTCNRSCCDWPIGARAVWWERRRMPQSSKAPQYRGDLVPFEGLSFRDLQKPLHTTNFAVSIQWYFTFDDDISLLKTYNVIINVKYNRKFSLKHQSLWYWGASVNPETKAPQVVLDPLTWIEVRGFCNLRLISSAALCVATKHKNKNQNNNN